MNWQNYVVRRRIDVDQWLVKESISTRETFLTKLGLLSVEPPDDLTISFMFPQEPNESVTEDESKPANTAQGFDTTSSRSVAAQAGEDSLHSGGFDNIKLRARGNKPVR